MYELVQSPKIMGVLNVTPDSFSDGGRFTKLDKALAQVEQMLKEGADIIDIGGESTRPGAEAVTAQEETDRVLPVVEKIKAAFDTTISVDTSKPAVMRAAIQAGAHMINDVYALRQPGALPIIANSNVQVCLMHMQGEPRTMQAHPSYQNVIKEIYEFLEARIDACIHAGISKDKLIIDPGFGFGKTPAHNLTLVRELHQFKKLGCPILIGASRKSSIGALLNKPVDQRLYGGLTLHMIALLQGASIIRTHDVAPTHDTIRMLSHLFNDI